MKQEQQPYKQVNAFTLGDWRIDGEYIKANYSDNNKGMAWLPIAQIFWLSTNVMRQGEAEANAALIASAPTLKAENEKLSNNLHILVEALELALNNAGKVSNCKAAYEISLRHPVTKALKEQANWYKTNFVDILNRIS